jgi:hypothetical protein
MLDLPQQFLATCDNTTYSKRILMLSSGHLVTDRRFEDYSSEDLWHIMKDAAKQLYGWDLDVDELKAGVKALESERVKPNFGNAGNAPACVLPGIWGLCQG